MTPPAPTNRRDDAGPAVRRRWAPWLLATGLLAIGGCAGLGPGPGDPVLPPPVEPAWRPGEALAFLLKPPTEGVFPIDDGYLARTRPYRTRISEAEDAAAELRRVEQVDRGGRRVWFLDQGDAIFVRIDVGDDGAVDQSQYFGPEGLFAIVHRFGDGRRTQRIYWPPGEARIVEIRDNLPPFPGVWWRTRENPFQTGSGGGPGPAKSSPKSDSVSLEGGSGEP